MVIVHGFLHGRIHCCMLNTAKISRGGTSGQQEGSETMKQDYIPLDQDTLTRLVYTHDDEITELTQKILLLIDRIKQVESELNGEI